MPISESYYKRLKPILKDIIKEFGTPFHIYDEKGIRENVRNLEKNFSSFPDYKEFFAVKALPNFQIMKILFEENLGFDCSSIPEVALAKKVGAKKDDIMFSSNNTTIEEFKYALDNEAILNLDDISLIEKLPKIPNTISFRYNPGAKRDGNFIIGKPTEAKFGVSDDKIVDAYKKAKELGVKKFGVHTMLASNELNEAYIFDTFKMLIDIAKRVEDEIGIKFEFINMGGGVGIPYKPEEKRFNIEKLASDIKKVSSLFNKARGYIPSIFFELGRYITGPYGALVTKVINKKEIYKTYIGVDACMSDLMRPGIYKAYHHITVLNKEEETQKQIVDVVGSLCENNDKFAIDRKLPIIEIGDTIIIHDTGAHGHAMGFNYNGRLRPKELLLKEDGTVKLIRREENINDYFATQIF